MAKYVDSYEKSQRKGLICIPSGNHDMDRLARTMQGIRQKIAFAFLLSMPGAPFIYYGDEIGMRYVEGLHSVEGGYRRTGSRTPMQWDHSANAGFSAASPEKLYLPLDETILERQRACMELLYDYNRLRPSQQEQRDADHTHRVLVFCEFVEVGDER